MIDWDSSQTIAQNLSSDTTSSTLTILKQMENIGYKLVLSELGRTVTEKTTSDTDIVTVASQQFYDLPMDCLFPKTITVKVGSIRYHVIECEDQESWDLLNQNTQTGDIPQAYFVRPSFGVGGSTLGLYPKPSSASNPIVVIYEVIDKDLSVDVYATGTVTFTNADATITGSGTTFTSAMVGRYIYCSNDGFWYRIITYTSATSIEIERNWAGTTTAGLTTNIREIFALPEEMQILPVYFALAHYFAIKKDKDQENKYWTLFVAGIASGKQRWGTKTRSNVSRSLSQWRRFSQWAPGFWPSSAS